jgi:hypothetical protein
MRAFDARTLWWECGSYSLERAGWCDPWDSMYTSNLVSGHWLGGVGDRMGCCRRTTDLAIEFHGVSYAGGRPASVLNLLARLAR